MAKRFLVGLAIFFSVLVWTGAAQADFYNAASGFSSITNPNGVWTYGWSTGLGSAFNIDSVDGSSFVFQGVTYSGLGYWVRDSVNYPGVWYNSTSQPISINGSTVIQPGTLFQHPGSDNSYSVLRWTAPNAGLFQLSSYFEGIYTGGTTTDVHVFLNESSIYNGYVSGYGDASKQVFSDTIELVAGDTIDFAVGPGVNGWIGDSTGTSVLITPLNSVPIPGAVWLLSSGLVGLIGLKRKSQVR